MKERTLRGPQLALRVFSKRGHSPNCQRAKIHSGELLLAGKGPAGEIRPELASPGPYVETQIPGEPVDCRRLPPGVNASRNFLGKIWPPLKYARIPRRFARIFEPHLPRDWTYFRLPAIQSAGRSPPRASSRNSESPSSQQFSRPAHFLSRPVDRLPNPIAPQRCDLRRFYPQRDVIAGAAVDDPHCRPPIAHVDETGIGGADR